jgi:hypothetical protein
VPAYHVKVITSGDEQIPPEPSTVDETDDNDPDWLGRMMAERPPDPILDVDQLTDSEQ